MKRLAYGLLVSLVTAAGSAGAQTGQRAGETVVTDAFVIYELNATGHGDIDVAIAFLERDGRVVICAATAAPLSGTLRQIMRAIRVSEGSTTILRGLQWAPNYPARSDLVGRAADCRMTRHPAPEAPDFGIALTRSEF